MAEASELSTSHIKPRSAALKTLIERGYLNQATNLHGLDDALVAGIVPAYVGFDATADSLHVGHLLPIMMLRRMQQDGHKPIVLIGGGTTRVGDPSFRSEARPMLNGAQISANIAGIRKAFDHFLTFGDGPTDALILNNVEWLEDLRWIEMLRDIGRHFSINRMLSFDSVKSRLEKQESLSFLEFNYMIMQAYDFLELSRRVECRLQMGGSDQWGNIINGIDLVRRTEGQEVFGLTAPLLTTSTGEKMGKTMAGAVWLNAERLSPYDYWQFWRNTEDADVCRFLRLFTDLPLDGIASLEGMDVAELNAAKELLANEATALAHGEKAAQQAAKTARQAFGKGNAAEGLPVVELTSAELVEGISLTELVVRAGLAMSNSEGRRAIAGRGVRLDGEIVADPERRINTHSVPFRLSLGRKRLVGVRVLE